MIGRRSIVGLSLLCALLFSAFAAQSVSAAASKNTTVFTCVKSGGTTNKDFSDAHCDKAVTPGTGSFEHLLIPAGTTEVELTNAKVQNNTTESDSWVLRGEPFKVPIEITCKTVNGSGWVENIEPIAGVHTGSGESSSEFSSCNVKKVAGCTTVSEPIVVKATGQGLEGLGAAGNEMGGEVKALAGKPFTTIELLGTCAIAKKPFNVEGAAVATSGSGSQTTKHSGATAVYTNAMTKETLTVGGKKAEISGSTTPVMKNGGNPLVATTTT